VVLNCIDGGVYANNPALAALVEIIANQNNPIYTKGSNFDIENVHVLSIGTGDTFKPLNGIFHKFWGKIGWAKPVLEIAMKANSQSVDSQLQRLLNDRYLRIDFRIDEKYSSFTDSSVKTRNYLNSLFEQEIINNKLYEHSLAAFSSLAKL
jgi:patatin-like phospholipase/acyl hydrolase